MHTILIIDGEVSQREFLCTTLKEKFAYQPIPIENGKDATHYVMAEQALQPDLILFDVSAVKDSCETIANLKILTSHTPIVALTKYGDYETASAAISAGAQDFLNKPVALERLGTTLRNLLQLRDAKREAERSRKVRINESNGHPSSADMQLNSPFMFLGEDGQIRRMEEMEAEVIRFAMQFYNGRMTEVARRLGIGRSTLYRKLNDLAGKQHEAA